MTDTVQAIPPGAAPSTPPTALVAGAGIAGLAASLALARIGYAVTMLDRDPPPPDTTPDEAFERWVRKGVGHIRHSHAFLAVLYQLIRDDYPDLLEELITAGCRELAFADSLPATLRPDYAAEPGDADLTILTSRRTTLEFVIRNYVARQPGITLLTGRRVRDVIMETADSAQPPRVTGIMVESDDEPLHPMHADLVIDATGRTTQFPAWFARAGIAIRETSDPCGIIYFTRHYRLRPGQEEPPRGNRIPGAGDLGYLKYGVFPGDNGCFSITLAAPEIETGLRMALVDPETFDTACRSLPGIARWIDEDRAEPASKVLGMGQLESRWRYYVEDTGPRLLNFFALGDAAVRTNPLYGRGCSFAFVEARALARTLASEPDATSAASAYAVTLEQEIRPYFASMVKQDLSSMRRAANGLDPDYEPSLKGRIIGSFADDAITPAIRGSLPLMREAMKGFHMLEPPSDWLKRPANIIRVLTMWAKPKRAKAHLYPPQLGPGRLDMHARLGAKPARA